MEVPFSHTASDGKIPRVISGTINLVFNEEGRWVFVDYKSDKIDGNMDSLIDCYKPQVEMYRDLWQKITGEKVKEAGLYFIDGNKWVSL